LFTERYPHAFALCPAACRRTISTFVPICGTYEDFPSDEEVRLEYVDGTHRLEGILTVASTDGTTLVMTLPTHLLRVRSNLRVPNPWTGDFDRRVFKAHLQRLAKERDLCRVIGTHGAMWTSDCRGMLERVASSL
jgi:hypothetical protein